MKFERTGDSAIVNLPESCEGKLSRQLYEMFQVETKEPIANLVIDFRHTTFIDSSFIGILVTVDRDIKSTKGSLVLKNMSNEILELFIDTGLDMLFSIEKDNGVTKACVDLFKESVDIKLEITTEIKEEISIFHLSGVMNHPVGSRYFKQQILLAMADSNKIILDFENLTFFDSLSVSVVISMYKLLKETGGSLRFCNPNFIVNDLFTTLNINQIIPVFESIDAAIASLK